MSTCSLLYLTLNRKQKINFEKRQFLKRLISDQTRNARTHMSEEDFSLFESDDDDRASNSAFSANLMSSLTVDETINGVVRNFVRNIVK